MVLKHNRSRWLGAVGELTILLQVFSEVLPLIGRGQYLTNIDAVNRRR